MKYYIVSLNIAVNGFEKDVIRSWVDQTGQMTHEVVGSAVMASECHNEEITFGLKDCHDGDDFIYEVNYIKEVTEEQYDIYKEITSRPTPLVKSWKELLSEKVSELGYGNFNPSECYKAYVELRSEQPSFSIDELVDPDVEREVYVTSGEGLIDTFNAVDSDHAFLLTIEYLMLSGTPLEQARKLIGDVIPLNELIKREVTK